jgi:hypothetical protein
MIIVEKIMLNKILLFLKFTHIQNVVYGKPIPQDLIPEIISGIFPYFTKKNKFTGFQVSTRNFLELKEFKLSISSYSLLNQHYFDKFSTECFTIYGSNSEVSWTSGPVEGLIVNGMDAIPFHNIRVDCVDGLYNSKDLKEFGLKIANKTINIFYDFVLETSVDWKDDIHKTAWGDITNIGKYAYVSGDIIIYKGTKKGVCIEDGIKMLISYYVFKIIVRVADSTPPPSSKD